MPMSSKPTSILLPDDLKQGLDLVRDRDGVPQSEQIRRAVRKWLEERGAIAPQRPARSVKKRR
jgi:metal-responsive CopG/Arc/MetJ family transcriptional regulator